jgi:hypothetical protein
MCLVWTEEGQRGCELRVAVELVIDEVVKLAQAAHSDQSKRTQNLRR